MNNRFLRACQKEAVDKTPVWFMRQAGRYMAEYRALRERYSLLEICRHPDLATEVTLQPLKKLEVDAAILFSDLLLPLAPMGLPFDFVKGEGPSLETPIRSESDIDRLRIFDPREDLGHVLETIKLVCTELDNRLPLIGFAGAPFTLASYAIEGGPSNNFARTKALMFNKPDTWHKLCEKLSVIVTRHLRAQAEAGVQALQIFDSWVGALNASDYREFALPHTQRIFNELNDLHIPTIHFGTGNATLLSDMSEAGGDVIGLDWRVQLDIGWEQVGNDRAIQGNLDPTLLLGTVERMLSNAHKILQQAGGRPGHIFNLGHGILPATPVENVQRLAHFVHEFRLPSP